MSHALPEPVVILAGGRGTRLQQEAPSRPKPMVEIGDKPILWHVIRIFAAQGCRRFVLCLGHRGEMIERFVDETDWPEDVSIECLDTGEDTPTGGRILRAGGRVDSGPFFATYADGVADVDLAALADAHRVANALATITVVRPELPFGFVGLAEGDRVHSFTEKPRSERWINGGFFCLEPGVLEYLDDDSVLEREPFERLAEAGRLQAFRHAGFWDCMDTYKDAVALDDLWRQGRAPWKMWAA